MKNGYNCGRGWEGVAFENVWLNPVRNVWCRKEVPSDTKWLKNLNVTSWRGSTFLDGVYDNHTDDQDQCIRQVKSHTQIVLWLAKGD